MVGSSGTIKLWQKPHDIEKKEVNKMSKEFFDLPESAKRMIWEALLARWETKKPATR